MKQIKNRKQEIKEKNKYIEILENKHNMHKKEKSSTK